MSTPIFLMNEVLDSKGLMGLNPTKDKELCKTVFLHATNASDNFLGKDVNPVDEGLAAKLTEHFKEQNVDGQEVLNAFNTRLDAHFQKAYAHLISGKGQCHSL